MVKPTIEYKFIYMCIVHLMPVGFIWFKSNVFTTTIIVIKLKINTNFVEFIPNNKTK